jgi:uncharacterized membrane protein YiaA
MIRSLLTMVIYEELSAVKQSFGALAVLIGLLIAGVGLLGDELPVRGYYFAGLLVFTGCAVRIETAIRQRPAQVEIRQES